MKKLALFEGEWPKVLIKVLLLLLVLYVAYRILYKIYLIIVPSRSKKEIDDYINTTLPTITPNDNSVPVDPDTISNSDAVLIANSQEQAMLQTLVFGLPSTNEEALIRPLECLNGASLQKIYAEFGVRNYEGVDKDLFGWYAEELNNATFSNSYSSECVEGCETSVKAFFSNSCYETPYMRKIWERSNIPITF